MKYKKKDILLRFAVYYKKKKIKVAAKMSIEKTIIVTDQLLI